MTNVNIQVERTILFSYFSEEQKEEEEEEEDCKKKKKEKEHKQTKTKNSRHFLLPWYLAIPILYPS